jgi:hypothetical protein
VFGLVTWQGVVSFVAFLTVVDGGDVGGIDGVTRHELAAVTWQILYGFRWPTSLEEGRGRLRSVLFANQV